MCPQRTYRGSPTLVCHLRLKDMQQLGPGGSKILYMTAPVASWSLGQQVVAISQKRIKISSTMSAVNLRVCYDDVRDLEGSRECSSLYLKFLHLMVKGRSRKSVVFASYKQMTINMYSDGSWDLIDSVNLNLAHTGKSRHSKQFNNNPKIDG